MRSRAKAFAADAGETMPLVLRGTQRLIGSGTPRPTIVGVGPTPTAALSATIRLTGTTNQVSGVEVRPPPASATINAGIVPASGAHTIADCGFTGAQAFGVVVPAGVGTITISGSSFTGLAQGVFWNSGWTTGSAPANGQLLNNTFSGNTTRDVTSFAGSSTAQITGSGNASGAGAITCQGCANCPF